MGAQKVVVKHGCQEAPAVHCLPCRIEFSGVADVATYFQPREVQPEGAQEGSPAEPKLEAAFRGRRLLGARLAVPDGYQGVILHEKKDVDGSTALEVRREFSELTYWNHDAAPQRSDQLPRAFEWLHVARAVASPVASEDFESALAAVEGRTEGPPPANS
ncbi:unnamed protein product [Pedinophyceae sp. YPF-701]|nr:unnamed protein product [Pedinophyceae sp. YPF-701]